MGTIADVNGSKMPDLCARVGSLKGTYKEINFPLPALVSDSYIRVRGTNSNELEPGPDPKGESPWTELWFYSNPVRIKIK